MSFFRSWGSGIFINTHKWVYIGENKSAIFVLSLRYGAKTLFGKVIESKVTQRVGRSVVDHLSIFYCSKLGGQTW